MPARSARRAVQLARAETRVDAPGDRHRGRGALHRACHDRDARARSDPARRESRAVRRPHPLLSPGLARSGFCKPLQGSCRFRRRHAAPGRRSNDGAADRRHRRSAGFHPLDRAAVAGRSSTPHGWPTIQSKLTLLVGTHARRDGRGELPRAAAPAARSSPARTWRRRSASRSAAPRASRTARAR